MGSGSTVAAAKHLGLKSIGLEFDQEFFLMARAAIPKLAKIDVDTTSVSDKR
jgi:DNA modification methylase